jgi:hypothetical protein
MSRARFEAGVVGKNETAPGPSPSIRRDPMNIGEIVREVEVIPASEPMPLAEPVETPEPDDAPAREPAHT